MNRFLKEYAQQIAVAVLQVAALVKRFDLRKKLEELSYHLLENIHYGNRELALATISTIKGFLELAKSVKELAVINQELLAKHLQALEKELERYAPTITLDNLFNQSEKPANQAKNNAAIINLPRPLSDRQRQILERIRQKSGKMHLKELIAAFPNASERTLRYDLKQLCDLGQLIRIGKGGPSNQYILKD